MFFFKLAKFQKVGADYIQTPGRATALPPPDAAITDGRSFLLRRGRTPMSASGATSKATLRALWHNDGPGALCWRAQKLADISS